MAAVVQVTRRRTAPGQQPKARPWHQPSLSGHHGPPRRGLCGGARPGHMRTRHLGGPAPAGGGGGSISAAFSLRAPVSATSSPGAGRLPGMCAIRILVIGSAHVLSRLTTRPGGQASVGCADSAIDGLWGRRRIFGGAHHRCSPFRGALATGSVPRGPALYGRQNGFQAAGPLPLVEGNTTVFQNTAASDGLYWAKSAWFRYFGDKVAGELEAIIDGHFCVAKSGLTMRPIFHRNHPSTALDSATNPC
jgi:hypothetical protein